MMKCQKPGRRSRPRCEALESRYLLSVSAPELTPAQFTQVLPLFAQNFSALASTLLSGGPTGERVVNEIDAYLQIPSLPAVISAIEAAPGPMTLEKIDNTIASLPPSLTSPRLLMLVSPSLVADLASADSLSPAAKGLPTPLSPTLEVLLGLSPQGLATTQTVGSAMPVEISALDNPAPEANAYQAVGSSVPTFERWGGKSNDEALKLIAQDAVFSFNDLGSVVPDTVSVVSQNGDGVDPVPTAVANKGTEAIDGSSLPRSDAPAIPPAMAVDGLSGSGRVVQADRPEAEMDGAGDAVVPSDVALPASKVMLAGLGVTPLAVVTQADMGAGGVNLLTMVTISAATLLFNRLDQLGRRLLRGHRGSTGGRELSKRDRAAGAFECVTAQEFLAEKQRLDAVLTSRRTIVKRCRELLLSNKELVRKNSSLADLAATDPLTGLKNRRHLHESIDGTLRFAAREGLPTSLIMLDVDHFKSYNDTLGHAAGDHVLRVIAGLLQEGTRPFDVVARYGGEEFVMLLPGANATAARRAAERLRALFGRNRWPHRPVTASFGIATAEPGAIEVAELLEQADAALYRAKAQGRDRVVHHDDLLPARAVGRTEEPALRARSAEGAEIERSNGHATALIHSGGRPSIFEN